MDLSFFMSLSGVQVAYMLIVVFLFVLAVIDLWVGVSNDAVNFIGSAVGCKAASLKHVMLVAAAGVFVGAAARFFLHCRFGKYPDCPDVFFTFFT